MFNTILAAYDGSSGADAALEKAAGLAKLTGAELIILTVYQHHSMLEASLSMMRGESTTGESNLDDIMRTISKEAAEKAKVAAKDHGVENVTAFIKRGPTSRTIVAFAEDKHCDLVVVGSRGAGSSEGYMLGSVSHKVTSLSDVPVLVV
ncbi:universal stress protein [Roseovarius aestuariivivens]|uniref:universal stress protein n=1 Tax=Roseovarius aestuariivivens TaxID=1888910 RepID=UPI001080CA87|nr:universal stress protein [Roseovarius aestuariivivens]